MLELYLSADGLRAVLILLLAIAQPAMGYWPQWRGWEHTTPSRSAAQQTPVVPIEWAFAIWGAIFTGLISFAVWQVLPAQLDDPLLRQIGWLAVILFALTVAWEYIVPEYDIGWPSVAVIVATLAALLLILSRIEAAEPLDTATFWLVAAPFQLHAGWISAAVFVNLSSTLKLHGVATGTSRAVLLMAAAALLGSIVAALTGAVIYAAAIAWALFGIVVANRFRDPNRIVAVVAALLVPVVPVVALLVG